MRATIAACCSRSARARAADKRIRVPAPAPRAASHSSAARRTAKFAHCSAARIGQSPIVAPSALLRQRTASAKSRPSP
jgi:hypothetical protein